MCNGVNIFYWDRTNVTLIFKVTHGTFVWDPREMGDTSAVRIVNLLTRESISKDGVKMDLVSACHIKSSFLLWGKCIIKMIIRGSLCWCHQYFSFIFHFALFSVLLSLLHFHIHTYTVYTYIVSVICFYTSLQLITMNSPFQNATIFTINTTTCGIIVNFNGINT